MNQKRLVFLLPVLLAMFLLLSGCKTVTANASGTIAGKWKDSYGLTEYRFDTGGKVEIKALNLGSFNGTYKIDGDKITIEYRVVLKDVKDTYTFKLDGDTMYLDNNEFTRVEDSDG